MDATRHLLPSRVAIAASCLLLYGCPIPPRNPILTHHNDNARTGAYLTERTLTPAAVATRGMVVTSSRPVDGAIQGQLLYVPSMRWGLGTVDAVFATTTNGSVYAYDANEHAPGDGAGLLWRVQLDDRCSAPPTPCVPPKAASEPFGVLSTPVIDPGTNTLYVVSRMRSDSGVVDYGLFALDIQSGTVLRHAIIGGGLDGGAGPFVPDHQGQRAALLLSGGWLYIAFGVWGSEGPFEYHGLVLRYRTDPFELTGVFNSSPGYRCQGPGGQCCPGVDGGCGGHGAGIWQAGGGPAADARGDVYVMTGNGKYDPATRMYGDSFVKLGIPAGGGWGPIQSFAPPNQETLDRCDEDLGSGGPLLIPRTDRLVGGGKTGELYVLERSNLSSAPQALDGGVDYYPRTGEDPCWWEGGPHLHGTPAYFQGANKAYVYIWAEQDVLRRFTVRGDGTLDPASVGGDIPGPECRRPEPDLFHMCPMPGGMLSISANGTSSGILWATVPVDHPGNPYYTLSGQPPWGRLFAYNAETMVLLWRGDFPLTAGGEISRLGKWTPPTVADGKVFVPTSPAEPVVGESAGRFLVYELGPPPARPPNVETALMLDSQGRLDVSWLDLGDGEGWHQPQAISGPVARPGAPVAMARQTDAVLTGLFFDTSGRLNVSWLDLGNGKGWNKPQAISPPVASKDVETHVAMAKQGDDVLVALYVDRDRKLERSELHLNESQWRQPVAFPRPFARPGAPVAMAKQTDRVLTALVFDDQGQLNVAWRNLDEQDWNPPQPFSPPVASKDVNTHVAMSKQSDTVLTALFFDRDGRLNVAWLDVTKPPWNGPVAIWDSVAPPGAHIAMARQTDTVTTAVFVGNDHRLNVTWLDLAEVKPIWHQPQPISDVVAAPGAAVALAKQSDQVLTALLVDQNGKLEVAWLDLTDGLGWHPPKPRWESFAPPGGHLAMERQRP